jgi:nucleotide-binding universal stress UspA family protein
MLKNILVPIDGSGNSILASKQAAELAKIMGAKLTVLHAIDIPLQFRTEIGYKDDLKEEGKKILEKVKEHLAEYNISYFEKIVLGNPAQVIIEEAKEGYDLVVIGNRGLGTVEGWVMGSVSQRVVRHAPCPVLVIKSN